MKSVCDQVGVRVQVFKGGNIARQVAEGPRYSSQCMKSVQRKLLKSGCPWTLWWELWAAWKSCLTKDICGRTGLLRLALMRWTLCWMILSGNNFDYEPFFPFWIRDETLSFLQQFGRSGAGRSVISGVIFFYSCWFLKRNLDIGYISHLMYIGCYNLPVPSQVVCPYWCIFL